MLERSNESIVTEFHKLYYAQKEQTWGTTFWLGIPTQKCPLDLWVYQEILYEIMPDLIIESGTADGGSALYIASICDLMNRGSVVTIDIRQSPVQPKHHRIHYLVGSSTSSEIRSQVNALAKDQKTVLVILDSDHHKAHVLAELQIYSQLITPGSYLIVEDTNLNGNPVVSNFGPGPKEAVEEFLKENSQFEVDKRREKFMITASPGGYLKRVAT